MPKIIKKKLTVNINIPLPFELHAACKATAERRGETIREFVYRALAKSAGYREDK